MIYSRGELTPTNVAEAGNLDIRLWFIKKFAPERQDWHINKVLEKNEGRDNKWEWDEGETFYFQHQRSDQDWDYERAIKEISELKRQLNTGTAKKLGLKGFIILEIEGYEGVFHFWVRVDDGDLTCVELFNIKYYGVIPIP